jgi:hypothetical protein
MTTDKEPTQSAENRLLIASLHSTRPFDGRRVILAEKRGGWRYTGIRGICLRLAQDSRHMVIIVENDPDDYWPVGMEILVELDHESAPIFGDSVILPTASDTGPYPRKPTVSQQTRKLTPEVRRGLQALACSLTVPQAAQGNVVAACAWLRATEPEGDLLEIEPPSSKRPADQMELALTPEVLRGFRALADALTVPQAEHLDVLAACAWLRAPEPEPTVATPVA